MRLFSGHSTMGHTASQKLRIKPLHAILELTSFAEVATSFQRSNYPPLVSVEVPPLSAD